MPPRRWRRLALSLPCRRVQLQLYKQAGKSNVTPGEIVLRQCDVSDTLYILNLVGGRKPLELELSSSAEKIGGWELLASALLPSVHRHVC